MAAQSLIRPSSEVSVNAHKSKILCKYMDLVKLGGETSSSSTFILCDWDWAKSLHLEPLNRDGATAAMGTCIFRTLSLPLFPQFPLLF